MMSLVPWQITVQNDQGDAVGSADIEVRSTRDNSLAELFEDEDGASPLLNPEQTAATGFIQFYTWPGRYRVIMTSGGSSISWIIDLVPAGHRLLAEDFGIFPDGNDHASKLLEAEAYLAAQGGGELFFGRGVYDFGKLLLS